MLTAATAHSQPRTDYPALFATPDEGPRVGYTDGTLIVTYFDDERRLRSLHPHSTDEPTVISTSDGGHRNSYNGLFPIPGNALLVWRSQQSDADGVRRILLSRLVDDENSDPHCLNSDGAAFHPVMSQDGDTLAAVWIDSRAGESAYQIRFNQYREGRWLNGDLRLDTGPAPAYDPMVAVREATLVAGWTTPTENTNIHLRHSTDGGDQWSDPIQIQASGTPYTPVLIATASAWRLIYFNVGRGLVVHTSTDGTTWDDGALVPGSEHNASYGFRWNRAGQRLCLSWSGPFNSVGTPEDVFATCSANGGDTWMPITRLDTDIAGAAASLAPTLSMDAAGRVLIAWQDLRAFRPEIRFNYSTDGGESWQQQDLSVTAGVKGHHQQPAIGTDAQGNFTIAWLYGESDDPGRRKHTLAWETVRLTCEPIAVCDPKPALEQPLTTQLEARLRNRATSFWSVAIAGDHSAMYDLMDPFFQAKVSRGNFLTRLGRIRYTDAKVQSLTLHQSGRRATVMVDVSYEAGEIALESGSATIAPARRTLTEEWIHIDDDWFKLYQSQAGDLLPRT